MMDKEGRRLKETRGRDCGANREARSGTFLNEGVLNFLQGEGIQQGGPRWFKHSNKRHKRLQGGCPGKKCLKKVP